MGEARRRRATTNIVYHHTSALRTNLIWMAGVIQIEGQCEGKVFHPHLPEIRNADVTLRRALKDFPAVAWFTTSVTTPKCLLNGIIVTSEGVEVARTTGKMANALAMNRVALGFPITEPEFIQWPQYYGYQTQEGRELNETARDAGDDPDDWYVSETPVDVMKAVEVWTSRRVMTPKMERNHEYLKDVHRMVALCRDEPNAYIPPSWLTEEEAMALAKKLSVPVIG